MRSRIEAMKNLPALLFSLVALAAQAQAAGCDGAESRQLDFWLGDWDLTYTQAGKVDHSRNHVTKTLDGCVVMEEFSGAPGVVLDGRSVSMYDRTSSRWKQTWVDNNGAYLDFVGGPEPGRFVLARHFERDGKPIQQRMVFQDIRADSLKWLWQRSDDGGATWATQWEIDYRRVR
jgi:hypothetical protein